LLYSSTELKSKGVYRFDADPGRLRVYSGKTEVAESGIRVRADRGKSVDFSKKLSISNFSVESKDSLHIWAARRSFELLLHTPGAMIQQTHWDFSASGRSRNADFHISLSSPIIAEVFAARFPQYVSQQTALDNARTKKLQDEIKAAQEQEQRMQLQQQLDQMLQRQQQIQGMQQNKKP
jgi:hypothetical protein